MEKFAVTPCNENLLMSWSGFEKNHWFQLDVSISMLWLSSGESCWYLYTKNIGDWDTCIEPLLYIWMNWCPIFQFKAPFDRSFLTTPSNFSVVSFPPSGMSFSTRPVCRHFMTPRGCERAVNCQFYHPGVNGPPLTEWAFEHWRILREECEWCKTTYTMRCPCRWHPVSENQLRRCQSSDVSSLLKRIESLVLKMRLCVKVGWFLLTTCHRNPPWALLGTLPNPVFASV